MQLAAANDAETTRERYMEIVNAKTAALFAAAAKAGAVAAGRPGVEAAAFETYGRELGLAFQLVDDALDYGGLAATMGKNTGDDFREGKVNAARSIRARRRRRSRAQLLAPRHGRGTQRR